jgi:hypothetical protein
MPPQSDVLSSLKLTFMCSFDKRFRIYDVYDFGETIRTYKRTEKDVILNEMILVGNGAPPAYEGT